MNKRTPFALASAALLLFAVYACNRDTQTDDASQEATPTPVTLSINSWVGWGPLFIAKERGYFGDLPVDIQFVEDAGSRRAAMIAGHVDCYASSVDNLAIDATYGVQGKIVLCFDESSGGDGIVATSDVTWDNISEKTIAVQQGLPGHFLLLHVLQRNQIDPSAISIIDVDADKAGSGFVAGSYDVAVTWEPWLSQTRQMEGAQVLTTTADHPQVIVDTLVVRDHVLASRPADVKIIVEAWFMALDWYRDNPSEGNQIIARAYNLEPAEVADMVSGITFYNRAENIAFIGTPTSPGPIYALFDEAASLWYDAGVIDTTPDSEDCIISDYVYQQDGSDNE